MTTKEQKLLKQIAKLIDASNNEPTSKVMAKFKEDLDVFNNQVVGLVDMDNPTTANVSTECLTNVIELLVNDNAVYRVHMLIGLLRGFRSTLEAVE